MNYYPTQAPIVAFNNVTLTASAAGNQKVFNVAGMEKLTLDINYTMGATESANKLHFTLEHSPDNGTNWYSLVIDSTTTVSAITPRVWEITGTSKVNVILDIAYKDMRMSVYESGVVTNFGTATVTATASGL
jgi:hypothetical protein